MRAGPSFECFKAEFVLDTINLTKYNLEFL